jgi:hypothetical protein
MQFLQLLILQSEGKMMNRIYVFIALIVIAILASGCLPNCNLIHQSGCG